MIVIWILLCLCLSIIFFKISWSLFKISLVFMAFLIFLFLFSSCVEAHEYNPYDIVLIGKIVEHEAGNQSALGKRLVCDTILNRVESNEFPNTVFEVIAQPGQYCIPKKYPPDGTYKLVAEEIYNRTNSRVLWYKTKGYHKYGTPILQEGNHYFSGR